jgi:hypothetical protein
MDATTISNRWIILSVSGLYKPRAIPVAWRVLPWHKPQWNPLWEPWLCALAPAFPPNGQGFVLADRGVYSPEWFAWQLGAHPLMRINGDGGVCGEGASAWQVLRELVPCADTPWKG